MQQIKEAMAKGFKPEIHFTMRNFEEALKGILNRTIDLNTKNGNKFGRTVPYSVAAEAHGSARSNITKDF